MRNAFLRFQLPCIWACVWVMTWSVPVLMALNAWTAWVDRRLPKPLPPNPAWYDRWLRKIIGEDATRPGLADALRSQLETVMPPESVPAACEKVSPGIREGVEDAEAAPEIAGGADMVDGREPK